MLGWLFGKKNPIVALSAMDLKCLLSIDKENWRNGFYVLWRTNGQWHYVEKSQEMLDSATVLLESKLVEVDHRNNPLTVRLTEEGHRFLKTLHSNNLERLHAEIF